MQERTQRKRIENDLMGVGSDGESIFFETPWIPVSTGMTIGDYSRVSLKVFFAFLCALCA
jgi:hypothetical protein